jgi:hypothetical protein
MPFEQRKTLEEQRASPSDGLFALGHNPDGPMAEIDFRASATLSVRQ